MSPPGPARRARRYERGYRALTACYPRRFREEYGADLVACFRAQCVDESPERVLARALVDLALTVGSQHLEVHMHRDPEPVATAGLAALGAAGATVAVLGGTEAAALVPGIVLAVAGAALAVLHHRRTRPVGPDPAGLAAQWWKLVLVGPGLVAAVVVAAGAGVDAWFVGMAAVAAGAVSTALGLVLGVAVLLGGRFGRRTANG